MSPEEVKSFVDECVKRDGCWYVWPHKSNNYSGKDLSIAKYPRTYDCSGLVTSSLYSALGVDWRQTKNAQKLADECDDVPVGKIEFGDLLFYGADHEHISHVMVYIGAREGGFSVFGASGGDSRTLTVEDAEKRDAKVKGYKNINYRPDFVSAGRLRIPHAEVHR